MLTNRHFVEVWGCEIDSTPFTSHTIQMCVLIMCDFHIPSANPGKPKRCPRRIRYSTCSPSTARIVCANVGLTGCLKSDVRY